MTRISSVARDEGRRADLLQLPQAELEPERKHQKDHAQLGERLDRLVIGDERKRRRVRADDHASEDVTEHDRLLEPVKNNRDQPGDDHHDREVLQEAHVMSRGSERHAVKSRALFPRREVYEAAALSTVCLFAFAPPAPRPPEDDGCGDKDGRVGAHENPDKDCKGEVVQDRPPKK